MAKVVPATMPIMNYCRCQRQWLDWSPTVATDRIQHQTCKLQTWTIRRMGRQRRHWTRHYQCVEIKQAIGGLRPLLRACILYRRIYNCLSYFWQTTKQFKSTYHHLFTYVFWLFYVTNWWFVQINTPKVVKTLWLNHYIILLYLLITICVIKWRKSCYL